MRAEAEIEELVGEGPGRLAGIVDDPAVAGEALGILRIEGVVRAPRLVGVDVKDVTRGVQRLEPSANVEGRPRVLRRLDDCGKIATEDHGTAIQRRDAMVQSRPLSDGQNPGCVASSVLPTR